MNYIVQVCSKCGKRSVDNTYWVYIHCRTTVEGDGDPIVEQEAALCPECNDEFQSTMRDFMGHGLWTGWSLDMFKEFQ